MSDDLNDIQVPGVSLCYPVKYTREILDMRNWLENHKQQVFDSLQCVNFESMDDLIGFDSEVFELLEKAIYFTGQRAWMADINKSMVVLELIRCACLFESAF